MGWNIKKNMKPPRGHFPKRFSPAQPYDKKKRGEGKKIRSNPEEKGNPKTSFVFPSKRNSSPKPVGNYVHLQILAHLEVLFRSRLILFGQKLFAEPDGFRGYFEVFIVCHNFEPALDRKLVRRDQINRFVG